MIAPEAAWHQPAQAIEALNPANYVPVVNPRMHIFTHQEMQDIQNPLRGGELPPLANGYSFVFDTRPTGHEDDYIHATDYADYFKRRLVPLAAVGAHSADDIDHAPGYTQMFQSTALAEVIYQAANNTNGQLDKEEEFTNTLDHFADAMSGLTDPDLQGSYVLIMAMHQYVEMANRGLSALIDQALGDTIEPGQKAEWAVALHQRIREDVGLAQFEVRSNERMELRYGRYDKAA